MSQRKKIIPQPQGFAASGFEVVMDAFKQGFSQGIDKGASLAVYYKGSLVANIWGGLSDEQAKRPWKEDTFSCFYSGAKFLSSLVIAHLVDKGLLNYEEKISKYWPEFGQNGKEEITLSMLLSHTAGLSILDENYQLGWMRDQPHELTKLLQQQHPNWEPGKENGYSQVLSGLYLNEIVKRVDPKGRIVSQYFHDEIAAPFGLDIHIGLPKTLYHRFSRLVWPQYHKEELLKMMADFQGDIDLYKKSISQPMDWNSRFSLNDPDFASLPSPSSHAMGTAKAVGKLASIVSMGGQHEGKTLLSQESIDRLQKPTAYKTDCILASNWTYGQGTMLIPARQGDKTWFVFGHTGLGGQAIWADAHKKFSLAYCTNYMNPFTTFDDNRWRHLIEAVYLCIQRIENIPETVKLFATHQQFCENLKDHPVQSKL